jgi:hypothetical protein
MHNRHIGGSFPEKNKVRGKLRYYTRVPLPCQKIPAAGRKQPHRSKIWRLRRWKNADKIGGTNQIEGG